MPACSSNYSNASRPSSSAIQYVIIHKVQGTASSAASWFQNCSAAVSAHFIFNNSSGYCYQSVREADIAWHCINRNTNGIGIEHGGYVSSNDTATVCYNESAIETRSCIIYYGVKYDRTHIQGHSEVPGNSHTDPGPNWNWTYYMSKCNPSSAPPPSGATTYYDHTPTVSANWTQATYAADKYGSEYYYRGTAAVSDAAVFQASTNATGKFDIYAWWPASSNRCAATPFILPDNTVVTANQQINGGKWNLLGRNQFNVTGAHYVKVSCWTSAPGFVMADAIKLVGPQP
jgi:N-acetyl-anhydromuramyl-L-alanine amidase AmpD